MRTITDYLIEVDWKRPIQENIFTRMASAVFEVEAPKMRKPVRVTGLVSSLLICMQGNPRDPPRAQAQRRPRETFVTAHSPSAGLQYKQGSLSLIFDEVVFHFQERFSVSGGSSYMLAKEAGLTSDSGVPNLG